MQTNYVGYVRGIDDAHEVEIRLDGERISHFTFGGEAPGTPAPISFAGNVRGTDDWENYTLHADDGLEVTLFVPAGPHTIGVSFPRETWEEEGVLQPRQTGFALAINEMPDTNPRLGSVQIDRPAPCRRSGRYADPPPHLHLPPRAGCDRRGSARLRPGDPDSARPPCLPAAGRGA